MLKHTGNLFFKDGHQIQIVQNLTRIDEIVSLEVLSEINILELHRIYTETIDWIDQNFSSIELDVVYQLFEFLTYYYEVSLLGKKIRKKDS